MISPIKYLILRHIFRLSFVKYFDVYQNHLLFFKQRYYISYLISYISFVISYLISCHFVPYCISLVPIILDS